MLAPTAATTPFPNTYDRSGKTLSLLRLEPAPRIATFPDESSTTTENYKDKVTLSEDAVEKSRQTNTTGSGQSARATTTDSDQEKQVAEQQPGVLELTVAEEKTVRQLRDRNREVKAQERAHLASTGQYARGGPTYSFEQKSDGRRYAVGGEVPIDISAEKTPEETLQKMQAGKRIASAPAEPSPADRSIAAAAALKSQAHQKLQHAQANPAQGMGEAQEKPVINAEEPQKSNEKTGVPTRRDQALDIVA